MPFNHGKDREILFRSIRLMICVGYADGYMGEREISRIHQLVNIEQFSLRERQILMDDLENPKPPEEIVADLMELSQAEKLTLMRQLYQMALIDRRLTASESQQIHHIARLLGIPDAKIRQVQEWVNEGICWRERWKQIVGE